MQEETKKPERDSESGIPVSQPFFSPQDDWSPSEGVFDEFSGEAGTISDALSQEAPFSILAENAGGALSERATARLNDCDSKLKLEFLSGNVQTSTEAFMRLYAKYEVPLLLYCKRMLRNEQSGEDAFQDTWTRVFEFRQRKDVTIDHFRGLLFQTARNLCFNMLRVEKPHSSEELDPLMVEEASSREATSREIQDLMVRGLAKLPFDQREIFVLHEYSGFAYGEIADMMQSSEQYVKVRAYRARIRLRKFIQGWLGLAESDDPSHYI
ncbi:MAG: RNA polymerase sigma factor [Bacteroidota bacterium]|nr:RNA polymerase sigma factor [Bacteroidota bacterium]MDP4234085.1 RNA polymerase sigma factor [Bacteroidota bacterium]MDP4243026.1 RNA polymerase sigma factor [Bacteroidota bacterium]MDP4287452.1 RNA polymerase sigma factor [Bacteroidota bacterium]